MRVGVRLAAMRGPAGMRNAHKVPLILVALLPQQVDAVGRGAPTGKLAHHELLERAQRGDAGAV
eukprot:9325457-Prorocentrum_lima.AAC.1